MLEMEMKKRDSKIWLFISFYFYWVKIIQFYH